MSCQAGLVLRLAAVVAMMLCADARLSPGRADYLLAPGDTVRLDVLGAPDLSASARIDQDGRATLPLVGPVDFGGLSAAQATTKLRTLLPRQLFSRRLADGRDVPVVVGPNQIEVTVGEYRPIYIGGDVGQPGGLAYQPGLTLRKVVALAGGLGRASTKAKDPSTSSEVAAQYRSLTLENAAWQEVVVRTQAELDGTPTLDLKPLTDLGFAPALDKDMLAQSQARLQARRTDLQAERDFLDAMADREGRRADILGGQKRHDDEGLKIDSADLDRYRKLYGQGEVAIPTLSLAQRTVLASSTRALQTSAALASMQIERSAVLRRREELDGVWRIDRLKALQDATIGLAETQARLRALKAKMRILGIDQSLSRGIDDAAAVTLTRLVDGRMVRLSPAPDDLVQPGDMIDVVQSETPP